MLPTHLRLRSALILPTLILILTLVACAATPAAAPAPAEDVAAPTQAPPDPTTAPEPTTAPAEPTEEAVEPTEEPTAEPTEEVVMAGPVTITDAEGNAIEITDASRVITLGGPITEIVYALGAESQLVGVDTSSLYPEAATQLPQVGYQRQLAAEGVLALNPTLIIGTDEAGPPEAIAQLRDAGITILILPAEYTVEGTKAKIMGVAQALGRESEGEALVTQLDADLAAANEILAQSTEKPRVMFIYARGAGSSQVAGTNTSADSMIALAGGENVVTDYEGYKALTAEAAVAAAPTYILMMDGGLASLGGNEGLLQEPGIAQTPAGAEGNIIAMEDLYLLGFGPRLGQAVLDLVKLLHPAAAGS